jgi:hypothetical protein
VYLEPRPVPLLTVDGAELGRWPADEAIAMGQPFAPRELMQHSATASRSGCRRRSGCCLTGERLVRAERRDSVFRSGREGCDRKRDQRLDLIDHEPLRMEDDDREVVPGQILLVLGFVSPVTKTSQVSDRAASRSPFRIPLNPRSSACRTSSPGPPSSGAGSRGMSSSMTMRTAAIR